MFEGHHAVMLLIEPEGGGIVEANRAAERFYGYTISQLRSMTIGEINILPFDEVEAIRRQAAKNELNYAIFPHRLANEEIRTVEVHSSPIDQNGKTVLFSIIHDITDRKMAEEALRQSEDKFRKAFFLSPDAIAISRLVDGMYVSINEGFKRIIGYDREEVIGKTSLELNVWASLEDRNKLIEILKTRDGVDNFEVRFRTKTGEIRCGLMSASIILLNGVEHILNIVRDITQRKLAEKLLHTTVQHYHAILSSMYAGVLVASEDGRVDFANQAFCDLFDIQDPPTKLQGLTPPEIIQRIQNAFLIQSKAPIVYRRSWLKGSL